MNMIRFTTFFGLLISLVLISETVLGQDYEQMRAELREQQEETRRNLEFLRSQIERYESEIVETETEYEQRFRQFEQLEREISLRDNVLENLRQEEDQIRRELNVIQQSYAEYEADLNRLIENYQQILIHMYKHGRSSELMMLVTSESLSQVQVRAFYLRKFQEYREGQALQIKEAQERLKVKEAEMEQARERNQQVIAESRQERRQLENRRAEQGELVEELRQDRESLERKLAQSRSEVENLNQTITQIIADLDEIRRQEEERFRRLEEERLRRLAEAEQIQNATEREEAIARLSTPTRRPSAMATPEEISVVEASFTSAKGDLPWPVGQGAIRTKFGPKSHPVYGTSVPNYGIEISTEARAPVWAVHDGFVIRTVAIQGYGDMVLVNHGKYITAYGNLSEVHVRRNDYVQTGDMIGLSGDDTTPLGNAVYFLIREDNTNVNPEIWITSRPRPIP